MESSKEGRCGAVPVRFEGAHYGRGAVPALYLKLAAQSWCTGLLEATAGNFERNFEMARCEFRKSSMLFTDNEVD